MNKEETVVRDRKFIFIAIIFLMIFECIQIPAFKIYIQSDDFGYIADAAYFAGYNWNPYTGDVTPYYAIGFSYPAAIFFLLFNSPITIYRGLLSYMVFLQLVMLIISYHICHAELKINEAASALLSLLFVLGALAPQQGLYFLAEIPYEICHLLSILLIIFAARSNKIKRIIYSAACGAITSYCYSVHARFLVLISSVLVLIILFRLLYKRFLVNIIAFTVSLALSFLLVHKWVDDVREKLFVSSEGFTNLNTDPLTRASWLPNMIGSMTDIDIVKCVITVFLSVSSCLAVLSGGLLCFLLYCTVKGLLHLEKVPFSSESAKQSYAILAAFCLISYLLMAISISINGGINLSIGQEKWLTYYRYIRPFASLFIITGGYIILLHKDWIRSTLLYSFCLYGIACFVVIKCISDVLQKTDNAEVSPVGWFKYYFYDGQTPKHYFEGFIIISFTVFCMMAFCVYRKNGWLLFSIYLIFSLALCISENRWNVNQESNPRYELIDATQDFFGHNAIPDDVLIYYLNESYTGKLRYALYNKEMIFISDINLIEQIDFAQSILISGRPLLIEDKHIAAKKYILDDGEYIYTSNSEMNDIINGWCSE